MGLPYEATFQFDLSATENGRSRLDGVLQFLREGLSTTTADASAAIEVETGDIGGYAYAMIGTERRHPTLADQLMQLEVRLCVAGDGPAQANFTSRFISADGVAPPGLRAGPPRLLLAVADEFECQIDGFDVAGDVQVVDADSVDDFVRECVFDETRTLPLLLFSESERGGMELDLQQVQRGLTGLGRVVHMTQSADIRFLELAGRRLRCFNGAARWLWPGCTFNRNGIGPSKSFYWQNELSDPHLVYHLQQTALEAAPVRDFDTYYSMCRAEVIFERNRQLEAERLSPQATEPDAESRAQMRREQLRVNEANRRLGIEQSKVARLDQQLAEAQSRIEKLETELDERDDFDVVYETERDRRDRIQELREDLARNAKTITQLNEELQKYRQEDRARTERDGLALPLGSDHPGWLTICQHALNIYRDPMRRYVIDGLRRDYPEDVDGQVKMSVDFTTGRTYKSDDPESSIDVGDFEELVKSYTQCFGDDRSHTNRIGRIRRFRNIVAHPPVGGIEATAVQEGLRNIKDTLERIGDVEAAGEVERLGRLIHHR